MQSVNMLSVMDKYVILSVVMLNVVMLNVVAPHLHVRFGTAFSQFISLITKTHWILIRCVFRVKGIKNATKIGRVNDPLGIWPRRSCVVWIFK
jgi:hypothetical protein